MEITLPCRSLYDREGTSPVYATKIGSFVWKTQSIPRISPAQASSCFSWVVSENIPWSYIMVSYQKYNTLLWLDFFKKYFRCMWPHMIQGYLIGIVFPLGTAADQHTAVPLPLCQWLVISWALETVMVKTFSLILWLVNVYMWISTVSSIRYMIWLTVVNCMFSPNFLSTTTVLPRHTC